MKIAVDFDHVLFDTSGFYTELPTDADVFKDTYEQAYERHNAYNVEEHVNLLNAHPHVSDPVTVEHVQSTYRKAPNYLRKNGLQKLADTFDLVLVTRKTHAGWQQQKVTSSGADRYVDEVIIVSGTPAEEPKNIDDAALLIDDTPQEHDYCDAAGILFDEDSESLTDIVEDVQVVADGGYDETAR